MLGNYKIVAGALAGAVLLTGCMMNDRGVLRPDEHLDETWNEDVNKTDAMQRMLYHTNQILVMDGVTFHDHVQKDMGLTPSEVWYPTEEMADGEVPFQPPCDTTCSAEPDPAKVDSEVDYVAPATKMAKPVPVAAPAPMPESAPRASEGEIDYRMLQRSIKSE